MLQSAKVYSSTLSALEGAGHWLMALALFDEMPTRKVEPNVVSYSVFLSQCENFRLFWLRYVVLMKSLDLLLLGGGRTEVWLSALVGGRDSGRELYLC